jgi:hypothetical protein
MATSEMLTVPTMTVMAAADAAATMNVDDGVMLVARGGIVDVAVAVFLPPAHSSGGNLASKPTVGFGP